MKKLTFFDRKKDSHHFDCQRIYYRYNICITFPDMGKMNRKVDKI